MDKKIIDQSCETPAADNERRETAVGSPLVGSPKVQLLTEVTPLKVTQFASVSTMPP